MFRRVIKELFTPTKVREGESQRLDRFLSLTCQSCPWALVSEITLNGDLFKVPNAAINRAREHFLTYRGESNQTLFEGQYQTFAGAKHKNFTISILQGRNSLSGEIYEPAVLSFDKTGNKKLHRVHFIDS